MSVLQKKTQTETEQKSDKFYFSVKKNTRKKGQI